MKILFNMNKVLLINPPFNILKANYDSSVSVGLLSIASYLDSQGVEVKILDGARQKDFLSELAAAARSYDYAALTIMTMQVSSALAISRQLKSLNQKIKIIWGGAHPTFFPEQTIKHELVDIVVVGEGEETILELARGQRPENVAGILYKQGSQIFSTKARPLHNPVEMPLFNWELAPREILERLALVPSLTSRGCPHRCAFCVNAILKNNWRPRAAGQVLEDLKIIRSKPYFTGKPVRFWDENFFVDIERAKQIINGMIDSGLVVPWETTVRANYLRPGMIDDQFLARIKQSGCYLLSFGAESGCPRLLKKMKKDIMPEDVINSAKMALDHDIIPQYSFMIGLPGETRAEMMETLALIDELVKLSPKIQVLGPQAFRPYPGSELYQECLASGWREPQSLEEWARLSEGELNYLSVKNFPWLKKSDRDFVESMEAYVRFGALNLKSALGSTVKAAKWLKLPFILLCQLRWKLKFFKWPVEFKLAKRFVSR
jgi:radical SAM superfamily enzyme YgiQ (UPF0313 family)